MLLRERAKALATDPLVAMDAAYINQSRFINKLTEHTFGETHGRFDQHTGWSNANFMATYHEDTALGQKYRNYSASWTEQHDFVAAAVAALGVPSVSAAAASLHHAIQNEMEAAQPRPMPPPGYERVTVGRKVRLGDCEVTLRVKPAAIVGIDCDGKHIVAERPIGHAGEQHDIHNAESDLIAYHYHSLTDKEMTSFRMEYAPSNNRAYGKNNLTNDTCASSMGCAIARDWPVSQSRAFLSVRYPFNIAIQNLGCAQSNKIRLTRRLVVCSQIKPACSCNLM